MQKATQGKGKAGVRSQELSVCYWLSLILFKEKNSLLHPNNKVCA